MAVSVTLDLTITTLMHIARGITEAKWIENRAWVKARYYEKRYYIYTYSASVKGQIRWYHGHKRVLPAVSINSGLERPYLPKIEKAFDDTFWWCGCGAPIQALHPMEGAGCHMAGDPHGDKREVVRSSCWGVGRAQRKF
jgi:hypothetical protein